MKRLVSTLNLSKEDWLRYRKCGITGTDAGAILGLNPYRSAFQVYHDKISDTIENIDNEAMRQGRDLEDYVAQRFSEETGFKVRRANAIYQSEEHPLLLADFDRLIVGQKAGLECKTVSPFSADKWADGKIPAHYLAQVNHYLAVSGFDCWYIAALIFGKELVIHKIISDKAVLDNLIAEEEHFWKYNVMPEIAPTPTGSEGDTQQIAPFIMVNHWGTIILAEPLELPDDGRRYIDEETDWNYDPFGGAEKNQKPCVTVGEFMNQYLNR